MELDEAISHGVTAMKVRRLVLKERIKDPKNHHFVDQIQQDINIYETAIQTIEERGQHGGTSESPSDRDRVSGAGRN